MGGGCCAHYLWEGGEIPLLVAGLLQALGGQKAVLLALQMRPFSSWLVGEVQYRPSAYFPGESSSTFLQISSLGAWVRICQACSRGGDRYHHGLRYQFPFHIPTGPCMMVELLRTLLQYAFFDRRQLSPIVLLGTAAQAGTGFSRKLLDLARVEC